MTVPWTWHGGGLTAAKRHFGSGGEPWIDLSTGINPHGWPGASALTIDWQRLPEPEGLARLEQAAAAYFGLTARHVCAVPGTEIGLRLVGRLIGGPARYLTPAYRTHREMIAGASAGTFDAMAVSGDTLVLANPTNPDGHVFDAETLRALLDRRDDAAWLLLDEAFADAGPHNSLAGAIRDDRRLVVFRSFGKFFGLAGVRLGFVLGPGEVVDAVRRRLGAWPLSAAAIEIGTAAYRDAHWIAHARVELDKQAAKLDAVLTGSGFTPTGNCPLFRLIEVADAMALFAKLARRAILTRPFADHPRWLRIGLPPDDAALDRLKRALANG